MTVHCIRTFSFSFHLTVSLSKILTQLFYNFQTLFNTVGLTLRRELLTRGSLIKADAHYAEQLSRTSHL